MHLLNEKNYCSIEFLNKIGFINNLHTVYSFKPFVTLSKFSNYNYGDILIYYSRQACVVRTLAQDVT